MLEEISQQWRELRARVLEFVETKVYPLEAVITHSGEGFVLLQDLMAQAKSEGLWALGHPTEIGGQGMPFLEYVHVNEVVGRSHVAMIALGTHSLQDSLMFNTYAADHLKQRYLLRMVQAEVFPSFAMTEPDIASSDPTQLQTSAHLSDGQWCINGRKWFTTGADLADYTTVMVRTEPDGTPAHKAFSMIVVPKETVGFSIVRDTPVLGIAGGHFELEFDNVVVPENHLLGPRGDGFLIAQKRLGPGRIFHCMRWLGQAQRAFDLMCERLHAREAFGSPLADKQLMQQHVFESATEIQAARLLTLDAAKRIDAGDEARVDIGLIKVVGARMLHNVIDRAIQVYGAKGLTDDTPLSLMYRHAREARIYDGPDEVHIQSVARRVLREYKANGAGWDFGARDVE